MVTMTLINNKGGVGKTTSVVNIAHGMALILERVDAPKKNVLIVDTDSQVNSTLVTTDKDDYGIDDSLVAVFRADVDKAATVARQVIVQSQWHDNLYILPGSKLLDEQERNMIGVSGAVYRLDDALRQLREDFAAIVIDTRPSFSLLTEMALVASQQAVVPVELRYLEMVGLTAVVEKIYEIRRAWRHPNLNLGGIIGTKYDGRVSGHQERLAALENHPDLGQLLLGVIPVNESISYAHERHMSIYQHDPRASAAQAYIKVVQSLMKLQVRGA